VSITEITKEIGLDDVQVGDINEKCDKWTPWESWQKAFNGRLNIIQFSVSTFHKTKHFSSLLCWLLKTLEWNLMYLHMFSLCFCINLRQKSQEPSPSGNQAIPARCWKKLKVKL
jgi:hypothetical protein